MALTLSEPAPATRGPLMSIGELLVLRDEAFVAASYDAILGRPVDAGGLQHYLRLLEHGASKLFVVRDLARSSEAKVRFEHLDLDLLSDDEFVGAIYQRLLGRDPEPAGKRHYLYVLGHGRSRKDVILEIESSQESQKRNPHLLKFKQDLAELLASDRREKGFWGRLFGWFTVRQRIVTLTEQLNDLKMEAHFQAAALMDRLDRLESGGIALGMAPKPLIVGSAPKVSARYSLPTTYTDSDTPQTIDEILGKVRAELANT